MKNLKIIYSIYLNIRQKIDNVCQVSTLDNKKNTNFFGVVNGPNGLTMKPATDVLHFNNGYNHVTIQFIYFNLIFTININLQTG